MRLTNEVIDEVDLAIALACKGRGAIPGYRTVAGASRVLSRFLCNLKLLGLSGPRLTAGGLGLAKVAGSLRIVVRIALV
jgi:hypothetical protein